MTHFENVKQLIYYCQRRSIVGYWVEVIKALYILSVDYSFLGKNACIDIQMGVCHTIPIRYDKYTSLHLPCLSMAIPICMCHTNIYIYTSVRIQKRSFVKSLLNLESRIRTETHVFVIERFYHHMASANY